MSSDMELVPDNRYLILDTGLTQTYILGEQRVGLWDMVRARVYSGRTKPLKGPSSIPGRIILLFLFVAILLMSISACRLRGGAIPRGEPVGEIPQTETAGTITLTGEVVYEKGGEPLPGITLSAVGLAPPRAEVTTITDQSGRFRLMLPPGKYEVKAAMQGFFQQTFEVTLRPGLSADISIEMMGDVIPRGERLRAAGDKIAGGELQQLCTICVVEKTFMNDASLHNWLNEQSSHQKIVYAIVPLRNQTSLYCTEPGKERLYTVITVEGAVDALKIQTRIELNRDMTLIGIHLLTDRFLIVFSRGK